MGALFSGRGRSEMRVPAVAGMFYPGSPSNLRGMIDDFLVNVEKRPIHGNPVGLIVPHAGYVYSGQVAAAAYKQIQGMQFDSVILLGVSHRVAIKGVSVYRSGGYETPLGVVEIDDKLADELMEQDRVFGSQPSAHAIEHSLEVQVPFLQCVLSNFKIVPILMGHWSEAVSSAVSKALAKVIKGFGGEDRGLAKPEGENGRSILLVASTDMSHYHSYETARAMDSVAISSIQNMDIAQLMDDLSSGNCELCGSGPTITMLMTARGLNADGVEILQYMNSGDVTGDKSGGVVGYFSAIVYQKTDS